MFVKVERSVTVDVDAETRLSLPVGGPYEVSKKVVAGVIAAKAGFEVDEDGEPVKRTGKSAAEAEQAPAS